MLPVKKCRIKSKRFCLLGLQDLKNQALHSFPIERKMLQQTVKLKEKTLKRTVSCENSVKSSELRFCSSARIIYSGKKVVEFTAASRKVRTFFMCYFLMRPKKKKKHWNLKMLAEKHGEKEKKKRNRKEKMMGREFTKAH